MKVKKEIWTDAIFTSAALVHQIWRHFLAALFGGTFWRHFLAALFGGTFWRHFLAALFGGTFWWLFLEALQLVTEFERNNQLQYVFKNQNSSNSNPYLFLVQKDIHSRDQTN
jgi:hypothetical protein